MPEAPRPPLLLQVVSVVLIVACLALAGFMATWLMSREWQEKTIAASVMMLTLMLAFLQYRGVYRADLRSISYAEGIAAILSLGTVWTVASALFFLGGTNVQGIQSVRSAQLLMVESILLGILLWVVFWRNEVWRNQLNRAAEEDRLPVVSSQISLQEIFLLILAVAFMAGIATYFVRQGYHYQLLF